MKKEKVKDLMVPLAEYATVSQGATLYDAVMALEAARGQFTQSPYHHRAMLVLDDQGRVIGKISQLDVLRALEPRYKFFGEIKDMGRYGLSREFLQSMMKNYDLWEEPLDQVCRKGNEILVKDVMYTPLEGEYVDSEASIQEAIHQIVLGHHQSLLVTHAGQVAGILRLTDLFHEVSERMKACKV